MTLAPPLNTILPASPLVDFPVEIDTSPERAPGADDTSTDPEESWELEPLWRARIPPTPYEELPLSMDTSPPATDDCPMESPPDTDTTPGADTSEFPMVREIDPDSSWLVVETDTSPPFTPEADPPEMPINPPLKPDPPDKSRFPPVPSAVTSPADTEVSAPCKALPAPGPMIISPALSPAVPDTITTRPDVSMRVSPDDSVTSPLLEPDDDAEPKVACPADPERTVTLPPIGEPSPARISTAPPNFPNPAATTISPALCSLPLDPTDTSMLPALISADEPVEILTVPEFDVDVAPVEISRDPLP